MKSQIKKLVSVFLCVCVALSVTAVASFASTSKTYTKIDRIADLTAGTYYMAGLKDDVYRLASGTIDSKDLVTADYTFADGTLTGSGAAEVVLAAVAGEENTYTISIGGQYLDVINATDSRQFKFSTTAREWTATNLDAGGILFQTTIGSDTCYFGSSVTANSRYIREYKASALSSIKYGVVFFKEAAAGGSSSSEESSSTETSSTETSSTSSISSISSTTSTPSTEKTFAEAYTEAQALAHNEKLSYSVTATGKITAVNTAYSEQHSNITVTIDVNGTSIKCYRAKGDTNNTETVKTLEVGDTITITGQLAKFYENVQFPANSLISAVVKDTTSSDTTSSNTSTPSTSTPSTSTPSTSTPSTEKTFAEAYTEAQALAHNEKLSYSVTATGKITAVNTAYSEQHSNITVTIDVNGTSIKCYRAKGDTNNTETVKTLEVGDTITITGQLAKFYENVQFPANSLISAVVKDTTSSDTTSSGTTSDTTSSGTTSTPALPAPDATNTLTVEQAIALGESKDAGQYTEDKYYVTGVITNVYNDTYGNMYITDDKGNNLTIYGTYDKEGKKKYGEMDSKPDAGDTVTLYGVVGKFNTTVQMKNAWIIEFTPGELEEENNDPADGTVLTIPEAIALGETKLSNIYTENKYYVTGTITGFYGDQGETYGNIYITDADGNQILVYGTYNEDGTVRYDALEVKPQVGDTVTVYGIVGNYNGTAQLKNGWFKDAPAADDDDDTSSTTSTPAGDENDDTSSTPAEDNNQGGTTGGDNTTGGTTGDDNAAGNGNGDEGNVDAPNTGDATSVYALLAIIALAGVAVIVTKKLRA